MRTLPQSADSFGGSDGSVGVDDSGVAFGGVTHLRLEAHLDDVGRLGAHDSEAPRGDACQQAYTEVGASS